MIVGRRAGRQAICIENECSLDALETVIERSAGSVTFGRRVKDTLIFGWAFACREARQHRGLVRCHGGPQVEVGCWRSCSLSLLVRSCWRWHICRSKRIQLPADEVGGCNRRCVLLKVSTVFKKLIVKLRNSRISRCGAMDQTDREEAYRGWVPLSQE